MITFDRQGNIISAIVFGEFKLADFKEFEALELKSAGEATSGLRLLFDLRQMAGATLDVAWEELKFSRQRPYDFERIAVLTDSQWVTWSAWLSQNFVAADLRVFDEESDARAWLEESA